MNLKLLSQNEDLQYVLHGLDEERECDTASGCCECDYICRCEIITSAVVRDTLSNAMSFASYITANNRKLTLDDVLSYRFAVKIFDANCFHVETTRGYYGDEIASVNYDGFLDSQIELFNSLSTTEKLKMLLTTEYGYCTDYVNSINEWELVRAKRENIHTHVKPNVTRVEQYKDNLKIGRKQYIEIQLQLYAPIVSCKHNSNDVIQYNIIDGNHRFAALSDNYLVSHGNKREVWKPRGCWVIRPKYE